MVLEKTLKSPLDCKEIQPVHPKGDQTWIFTGRTDAKAETPILWPPDVKNWPTRKDPDAGKDWRWEEKGTTEDEMVGWHHRLDGYEFEQAPGVHDGQGSLACCSLWGHKESDTTAQLKWTVKLKSQQHSATPREKQQLCIFGRGGPFSSLLPCPGRNAGLMFIFWVSGMNNATYLECSSNAQSPSGLNSSCLYKCFVSYNWILLKYAWHMDALWSGQWLHRLNALQKVKDNSEGRPFTGQINQTPSLSKQNLSHPVALDFKSIFTLTKQNWQNSTRLIKSIFQANWKGKYIGRLFIRSLHHINMWKETLKQ